MTLRNAFENLALDATVAALTKPTDLQATTDKYTGGQILPDQEGANGVLEFVFDIAVDLAWVVSSGGDIRIDPFGGTPSPTQGIFAADRTPYPLTITTAYIYVYASTGTTVTVWGFRYPGLL